MGGGILTYLIDLCNALCKDYEITILYGVREQTPHDLRRLFDKNIELVRIKNFQRSLNLKSDFKSYEEIKEHIESVNPDVVHLNSSKAGALGRILKILHFRKLKNTQFYYTPHGYSFLMGNESKLKKIFYYSIEKFLSHFNTVTVACGKSEYDYAYSLNKKSIYVNNGVDINKIDSLNSSNDLDKNIFYTVGRIDNQKNPMLFNEIALHHPEIKFVWIGDGPLRHLLNAKNVSISGWLDHEKVISTVSNYANFIMTSKWEGLPIALLEAMAMGKNCFVTNVEGNKDVINEYNGYKFSSVEEFDSELYQLKKKNFPKGKQARNDVEINYSKDSFISNYKRIYG